MKNAARKLKLEEEFTGEVKEHEHIHAANCGHPSFVHGDHVDYLHDGHYHYYLDGKTYDCEGPKAAGPASGSSNRGNAKPLAKVIPLKKK